MSDKDESENAALSTFVGDKYSSYYEKKWQLNSGQLKGFNVAAFFLGVVWLIYRKMYIYALIFIMLIGLDIWIETYYPLPDSVGSAINIAIATTFGILGNTLYKTHAEKKVKEILSATSAADLQLELNKKGGTNLAGAIAFGTIILLIIAYGVLSLS